MGVDSISRGLLDRDDSQPVLPFRILRLVTLNWSEPQTTLGDGACCIDLFAKAAVTCACDPEAEFRGPRRNDVDADAAIDAMENGGIRRGGTGAERCLPGCEERNESPARSLSPGVKSPARNGRIGEARSMRYRDAQRRHPPDIAKRQQGSGRRCGPADANQDSRVRRWQASPLRGSESL